MCILKQINISSLQTKQNLVFGNVKTRQRKISNYWKCSTKNVASQKVKIRSFRKMFNKNLDFEQELFVSLHMKIENKKNMFGIFGKLTEKLVKF